MKMISRWRAALLVFSIAAIAAAGLQAALADSAHDHSAAAKDASATPESALDGQPYPLDFCPVTGEKLGSMGDAVAYDYEGREIKFCCSACIESFEAEPAKYIALVDEAIIEQQLATYPLTTCPVSGMDLDGMGEAVDYVYDNRLVRFCCSGCIKGFEKDPQAAFAEIDAAIVEAQSADYPLTTCPVSGAELGADAVDHVVAGRLFRLCCAGCTADVDADPAKYIAILDEAAAE